MYKTVATLTLALILLIGCEKVTSSSQSTLNNSPIFEVAYRPFSLETLNSASELTEKCNHVIAEVENKKTIAEQSTVSPTQANFYQPVDAMMVSLANFSGRLRLISDSFNGPKIREAARFCSQRISSFESEIRLSKEIYKKYSTIQPTNLDDETKYSIKKQIRRFQHNGIDKDKATREKIHQLNNDLTKIGQEFNKNITEGVRFIKARPEELKGVPDDYIKARTPDENGFIEISTRYPDLIPIISYAENDNVKKRLWFAFWQRAYPENVPVVEQLLQKRFEYAQLLGYENYAHFILSDKMAKTPERVKSFLSEINEYTKPADQKDYDRMLSRLRKIDPSANKLELWQRDYIFELVLKEQLNVDSQAIRNYFSFDKAQYGILALVQELFDVQIKDWDTWVWDESVTAHEIYDNGRLIGQFYLDAHPREGKFSHAKVIALQLGITNKQIPVASMLANFPKSSESLSHNDLITFLHEFGHVMHVMFSSAQWSNTVGISTERDFIEAPSQLLEQWFWHYPTLSRFATNKAGEVLPKAVFDSMKAARDFNLGMNTRQQLHYGAFSLDLFNQDPSGLEVDKLSDDLQSEYTLFPANQDQYLYTSFTHLNGYSATYYTYQWSLAISTDIFSKFETNGMMDKSTADAYRKIILEQGGKKPADDLIADFLGRPVSFEAYAERLKAYSKK